MNEISLKPIIACLAAYLLLIPLANGQGMVRMKPSVDQVEAIEGHLQQSRTQSSKESEGIAKKKPRTYELPTPASNTPAPKQKKLEKEGERAPSGSAMKSE